MKRLKLRKEILRDLDGDKLKLAAGGVFTGTTPGTVNLSNLLQCLETTAMSCGGGCVQ